MKRKIIPFILIISMLVPAMTFAAIHAENDSETVGTAVYTDISAYISGHGIRAYIIDGDTYIIAEELKNYGFIENISEDGGVVEITRINGASPERRDITGMPKGRTVGTEFSKVYASQTEIYLDGVLIGCVTAKGESGSDDLTLIKLDTVAEAYASGYVWDGEKRELRLELAETANKSWTAKRERPELTSEQKKLIEKIVSEGVYDKNTGEYTLSVFSSENNDSVSVALRCGTAAASIYADMTVSSPRLKFGYEITLDLVPDADGSCAVNASMTENGGKALVMASVKHGDLSSQKTAELTYIHGSGANDVIDTVEKTLPARISVLCAFIEKL